MQQPSLVINGLPFLTPFTGIARYGHEVSKRLLRSGRFDTTFYYGYCSRKLAAPRTARSGAGHPLLSQRVARTGLLKKLVREGLLFSSRFLLRSWDLYWEFNNVPVRHIRSRRLVTTIHDFSFHVHPEWHPAERHAYFRKHFWSAVGRSDRIIAVSEFTKAEAVRYLACDPARIEVIYHGIDRTAFRVRDEADLRSFRDRHGLPEQFILFVGSIEPRKNVLNALRAYAALPESFKKDCKFVLAGSPGWHNDDVMELIRKDRDHIRYLGYLGENDLALLYGCASVFLYPSLYEGFGLPPLEAMACGTPVVVSRSASLPEVCGDAAWYVDPHDSASIGEGILRTVTDSALRQDLARRGRERAGTFCWDRSAAAHASLFTEVLGG